MTKTIMLQGTGSDVGKTVLVAGLCRLAANRGLVVRPFKPQNMSNNAAVAADGGEMGRAQWLQALACRVPPSVHMNPVLLKPQSETGSQIVVQGKVTGQARGRDYQALKPSLMAAVLDSFKRVSDGADLVIVEGAGSPAEINLRAGDIANMGFATRAEVPVVLVGDIDRGGVIASIVGTHAILPEEDRRMIQGYIINKFRGDVDLFSSGIEAIEGFTGWPCFGVVPWLAATRMLPAEDSVALERLSGAQGEDSGDALVAAVPMLSRIANFDDLDPLRSEPGVRVVFVRPGERFPDDTDLIVLPGSKSTIGDLIDLRTHGWHEDIARHVARDGHVMGLCGGYQMLGRQIFDPLGLEGSVGEIEGLGLLDVETVLAAEKTVRTTRARSLRFDLDIDGYEIHLGETSGPDCAQAPFSIDGRPEGAMARGGLISGSYLHGIFENDEFRRAFLGQVRGNRAGLVSGLADGEGTGAGGLRGYRESVEAALDQVAADLERVLAPEWLENLLRPASRT